MNRHMFRNQVAALREKYRIVAWDARGHGDSEPDVPDSDYSYWDQARDCLALMRTLGIRSAVVGGMSQGGYIAMRMALLEPTRVSGLALIATEPHASSPAEVAWYEDFFEKWVTNGPCDELVHPLAERLIGPTALSEAWVNSWRSTRPSDILSAARCLIYRDTIADRVSEIRCPVAIIHGTNDAAVSIETARRTARLLDSAPVELTEVVGGTHSVNLTHPTQVNAALMRLMATTNPDTRAGAGE